MINGNGLQNILWEGGGGTNVVVLIQDCTLANKLDLNRPKVLTARCERCIGCQCVNTECVDVINKPVGLFSIYGRVTCTICTIPTFYLVCTPLSQFGEVLSSNTLLAEEL